MFHTILKLRTLLFSSLVFLPGGSLLAESDTEKAFSEIYHHGLWGKDQKGRGTSGSGSSLQECGPYINFLFV